MRKSGLIAVAALVAAFPLMTVVSANAQLDRPGGGGGGARSSAPAPAAPAGGGGGGASRGGSMGGGAAVGGGAVRGGLDSGARVGGSVGPGPGRGPQVGLNNPRPGWSGRHHHRHHGHGHHRHHRRWVGPGIGFGTGLLFGGALAAPYYYDEPYYDYYEEPRVYSYAGRSADEIAYCRSRFKSYDVRSGTYLGYDGERHPCP